MGGCLTVNDTTTHTESAPYDDNNDEKQIESAIATNHYNNNTHVHNNDNKECESSDIYCSSSDWLKFPICCRYCSNHREPSQEFQLVILGPGYTGKTTLRHHLVQRYGHAFCKADFLMYRDILQHNVLDLFRDLLNNPSLTFKELKQFVKYIHRNKEMDLDVVHEYDHESIHSVITSPELSPELDLGLHDLSEDDDIVEAYKYKQYLSPQQIHSNSSSLRSLEIEEDEDDEEEEQKQMDLLFNDMMMNDIDADSDEAQYKMSNNKYKTPFSSPMLRCKSPSSSAVITVSDDFKIMESPQSLCTPCDARDEYHDYCVLNQCSPTTPNPAVESSPNTAFDHLSLKPNLNPSLLSLKLDAVSNDSCSKQEESKDICGVRWRSRTKGAISSLLNTFLSNNNNTTHEKEEKHETHEEHNDLGEITKESGENEKVYEISSVCSLIDKLNNESLKYGRDNGRYLILNSERILLESFEPTFSDLLQCHVRSTGLMFENHVICRSLPIHKWPNKSKEDIVFRVVDVGGHRNERKKWSYVLKQQNDVIVFVVSAASFCQVLFEDFKKNAMRESIAVWKDIISSAAAAATASHAQEKTQFILVINKIDLFYERCHLFKEYFTEYQGDLNNKSEILKYIKSLYLDIAQTHAPQHNVHCVVTQLTDTLEIASADVDEIKHVLMNISYDNDSFDSESIKIHKDIVDTIVDYAIGDVFWSEKWLKPMWENRNGAVCCSHNYAASRSISSLCTNEIICDHINNPHDYHRHKRKHKNKRKRRNKSKKLKQNKTKVCVAIEQMAQMFPR